MCEACQTTREPPAEDRSRTDTIVFATPSDATTLDPAESANNDSDAINLTIYDGLLAFDDDRHIVGWKKDLEIVLERNDDYWGDKPRVRRVVYRPVPDVESKVAALEAGDVEQTFQRFEGEKSHVVGDRPPRDRRQPDARDRDRTDRSAPAHHAQLGPAWGDLVRAGGSPASARGTRTGSGRD